MPIGILLIAIPLYWIVAEIRGSKLWIRIASGILAIAASAYACTAISGMLPHYERALHKVLFRDLAASLSQGRIQLVTRAISTYNSTMEKENSTYLAADKALRVFDPPKSE